MLDPDINKNYVIHGWLSICKQYLKIILDRVWLLNTKNIIINGYLLFRFDINSNPSNTASGMKSFVSVMSDFSLKIKYMEIVWLHLIA
jgi:hypothetical protein